MLSRTLMEAKPFGKLLKRVAGGTLLAAVFSLPALAGGPRDVRRDARDIRHDTRDIRHDRRDLRKDLQHPYKNRADIHADRRDLRHDRQDRRHDARDLHRDVSR
ncbi:MAG TPA: hypothetical protein VJV74_14200 [Terriglobia bacterium]|nr:hypothetical protein [Terriglobia bacterium]